MGGGGAMRAAAAKVAGFTGVIQGGFRGSAAVPPVEQSVRKVSVPVSASISSSQSVKAAASASDVASVQKPAWEIDDWEFAGGENELVMAEPMPRVVFGGVPTLQEAKEATTELKDALEQLYLSSPKSSGSAEHVTTDQAAGMSLFSNSDSETKSCLIVETKQNDSIPKHALQAFRYLSASPDAQNVVASIARDPNVWNAVMRNPELQQFIDSQQTVDELQDPVSFKKLEDEMTDSSQSASQSGEAENGFMDILQNIKFKVMDMVSNVSSFFNDIFGLASDVNGDAKTTPVDRTLVGASLMGLAVLVIMVVVLKRG